MRAGLLGVHSTTQPGSGGGYEVTVEYAAVARAGLDVPWKVQVRRAGGFDGPVTLAVTADYFDIYEEQGLDPQPTAESSDGTYLYWTFDPPPVGDQLAVDFDAYIQPSSQLGLKRRGIGARRQRATGHDRVPHLAGALMEIVVRAVLLFGFLWLITRVVGRSTLGELSTFQLLLFVTMGDLVQQSITQQDYSLTSGVLAVGVFALLTILLSWVNARWPGARPTIHGIPVVIMQGGDLLPDMLRRERLSANDVFAAAREKGIRKLDEVELAVLEADGKISFFAGSGDDSGAPERPPVG